MCIIITKEKSAKPLPEEIFDIIWTNNPDGAGILYNNGKETILEKGIMKKEDFIKAAKEVNKKGISYIMHTRIATHGSVKPENTHPFISKKLGFAHNGTFSVVPFPDMTDSETFFREALGEKSYKWCNDNKFLLDMATHGCRCAIMDLQTGDIMHLCEEDWKTDIKYQGYKFSNSGYEYHKVATSWRTSDYDRSYMYGGYDYDDDDLYDYPIKKKEEPKELLVNKINCDFFRKTKGNYLVMNGEWGKTFLENYAEKKKDKKLKRDIIAIQRILTKSYEDLKDYNGENSYECLASHIIRSFIGLAICMNYTDYKQVMKALEEMVVAWQTGNPTEADLKNELFLQIEENR